MFAQLLTNTSVSLTRFDVPDRLSGLASLQELNPRRKWNFVMVHKLLIVLTLCRH